MSMRNVVLTADQCEACKALMEGRAQPEDHKDLVQMAVKHLWEDSQTAPIWQPASFWGRGSLFDRSFSLLDRFMGLPISEVALPALPEGASTNSRVQTVTVKREMKEGQLVTTRHEKVLENGEVTKDETSTQTEALPAPEEAEAEEG